MCPRVARRLRMKNRMIPKDAQGTDGSPWYRSRSAMVAHEDSQTRMFLQEALSRAGYVVHLCDDSHGNPESHIPGPHSLLVMNGDPKGLSSLRTLRGSGNPIPVILLSQTALETGIPPDPGMGAVEWLSAPFTLTTLRTAIAQLCRCESGPRPVDPEQP